MGHLSGSNFLAMTDSIQSQGRESWSHIIQDEGVVCIGEHRLKAHTIEQILYEYNHINIVFLQSHYPAATVSHNMYWAKVFLLYLALLSA